VTPGNAPGPNDGASALSCRHWRFAKEHGVKPMARITGYSTGGGEPKDLSLRRSSVCQNLMKTAGTKDLRL